MEYLLEKNELWKDILQKRTSELTTQIPDDLLAYLTSWRFLDFH